MASRQQPWMITINNIPVPLFIMVWAEWDALQQMRSSGIYLIQAEVGSGRFCILPAGEITITFRVGRSSASHVLHNATSIRGELPVNCLIQLNVDSTALEAQRCSLTFSGNDKHVLGIALISLPREKNLVQSTYRITQNEDKRAEVDLRIKISPLQGSIASLSKIASQQVKSQSSSLNLDSIKPLESKAFPENILPKIYVNNLLKTESSGSNQQSNIKLRSKISEQYSQGSSDDRMPRGFKVREEDRVVQTTESELRRFKEEKEVYYQLYQIEKGKNEVAAKFITGFLKKATEKCPSLASLITDQSSEVVRPVESQNGEKKGFKNHQQQQQADSALIAQLEQANRTLHRQVEDYKRLVEQMKLDIIKPKNNATSESKATANMILPGLLELSNSKSVVRERSKVKSTGSIKEPPKPQKTQSQLKQVDFNKWLNLSIGQRETIQTLLENLAQKPIVSETIEKKQTFLKKLKGKLDKSFTALLARKEITKEALLNHKKQVNKFFEEVLNF